MTKRKRKVSLVHKDPEKYSLGSFVTNNQAGVDKALGGLAQLGSVAGNNAVGGALKGVSMGASMGSIIPGVGTVIGGALGGIGGAIFGGAAKRRAKKAADAKLLNEDNVRRADITEQFEGQLDTFNENPYGVYEEGGDVLPDPVINIEKGELQINPESGKILRKFEGINPETGGFYEDHSKDGKDTSNNMVTAQEGSFIITKKDASKYKKAVDNNDKLQQESIMQNIRNVKKRSNSLKFAKGGTVTRVNPNLDALGSLNPLTVSPNLNITTPSTLQDRTYNVDTFKPNTVTNSFGSVVDTLDKVSGYLPGAYNIIKGSQAPNYQSYRRTSLNPYLRQQTLNNMPEEVSVNPVLNTLAGQEYTANRAIDDTVSNPNVARAIRANIGSNAREGINEAYVRNNATNADIRTRRAGIYDSLSQQDTARSAQNASMMLGVDETNRRLDLAKEQQVNTGIGQLQEVQRNNQTIRDQRRNDKVRLGLLKDMFPASKGYSDEWLKLLGTEYKR